MTETINIILKSIETANNICIISHFNPDGDAVGSSLGLLNHLNDKNKNAKVILPSHFPDFLRWLPESNKILVFTENKEESIEYINKCDLIFFLDFNHPSRTNEMSNLITNLNCDSILIDHHPQPEYFAKTTYSKTSAAATAQLVFEILENDNTEISQKTAQCLYTGLLTDTCSFSCGSINAEIFNIASKLISKGANHILIHNAIFNNFSTNRLQLLGNCLLNNMKTFIEKNAAYIYITKDEILKFEMKTGDTEGIVNYPLTINGINISLLFVEYNDYIRISFRSFGDFDVNLLARKYYNGGGHKNAAGAKFYGTLKEAINIFENINI